MPLKIKGIALKTIRTIKIIGGPDRGNKFKLNNGSYAIGRDPSSQIRLDSPMVSRLHSTITVTDEEVIIKDHGSSNGTAVNGKKINEIKLWRI